MKTKKKVLIGLMALCLAGGIGSAFALVTNGASNQSVGSGTVDTAIYLHFNDANSQVAALTSLGVGSQFRYVVVDAPSKSTSVTGNYTVTFTLRPEDAEKTLAGVTCKIYKGVNSTSYVSEHDHEVNNNKVASVPTDTLNGGDAEVSKVYNIPVTSGEEFYLEFNYSKVNNNPKELGGSLFISLGKAA